MAAVTSSNLVVIVGRSLAYLLRLVANTASANRNGKNLCGYGGLYVAASLVWLDGRRHQPRPWDVVGSMIAWLGQASFCSREVIERVANSPWKNDFPAQTQASRLAGRFDQRGEFRGHVGVMRHLAPMFHMYFSFYTNPTAWSKVQGQFGGSVV